jgi:hypothetical protein
MSKFYETRQSCRRMVQPRAALAISHAQDRQRFDDLRHRELRNRRSQAAVEGGAACRSASADRNGGTPSGMK